MSVSPDALAGAAIITLVVVAATHAQPIDIGPGAPSQSVGSFPPYDTQQPAGGAVTYTAPAAPIVTYALLPGHWALRGADYVWVPPERVLRPVQSGVPVPGRYVWRDGAYVWVPAHYDQR